MNRNALLSVLKKSLLIIALLILYSNRGEADTQTNGEVIIIQDNAAQAAIIIPDKAIATEEFAAEELKHHIFKASGVNLPIFKEAKQPKNIKYFIYIGNCRETAMADINPSELQPSEYFIKTVGPNLFLTGKDRVKSNIGNHWAADWQGTLFAVYDLLENEMGVHWLWPGELGEIIPAKTKISFKNLNRTGKPLFVSSRLTVPKIPKDSLGWSSIENKNKFINDQDKFLLRHRFATSLNMFYGHNFGKYWERFNKTNPEFFNLLVNGKREPLEGDQSGSNITMCVSQPKLWEQIVSDWEKSPERNSNNLPYKPFVNACENDSPGLCTCEKCRSWDAQSPDFETSDYWGKKVPLTNKLRFTIAQASWGEDALGKESPSLSDRYARFYTSVLEFAKRKEPNAQLVGYAYANYWEAPKKTKLSKDITISYVPPLWFPYTDEMSRSFRENWDGWRTAGVEKMILRPNLTHAGANLPIFYAKKIAGDFSYAAKRGMIATAFDSLLGTWSAQGPTLYALVRIHEHPDWTAEKILDEYYSGFGKAKDAVKKYFECWEKYSDSIDEKTMQLYCAEERDSTGRPGGGFKNYVRIAHRLFPAEVLGKARKLIEEAMKAAKDDQMAKQRISFLEKGLTDVELTVATRAAQAKAEKEPTAENKKIFESEFKKLVDYRASVEADNICNFGYIAYREMNGSGWMHKASRGTSPAIIVGNANGKYEDMNWDFEDIPCGQFSSGAINGDKSNNPLAKLAPWTLSGEGAIKVLDDGKAFKGKKYLLFESFKPYLQREIKTVAGKEYRIHFYAKEIREGEKTLAVYWNDTKLDQVGTQEWKEYTMTATATGKDILKFQRVGKSKPILDAVTVEEIKR